MNINILGQFTSSTSNVITNGMFIYKVIYKPETLIKVVTELDDIRQLNKIVKDIHTLELS